MQEKQNRAKMVLISGIIGIVGVLVTIISDFILIGKPTNAYSFFKLGTETMAGLPQWRLTIGTFLGIIALPFQLAGLISLYYGLKQAGKLIALVIVIIAGNALIMGVAFHFSYAFIGSSWKLYYESGPNNLAISEIVKRFDYYWKIIIVIMAVELFISSMGYVLIIVRKKTLFPKWMAIVNPSSIFIFVYALIFAIPAPLGGFIAAGYCNLSTLVFFTFITTIVYKQTLRMD